MAKQVKIRRDTSTNIALSTPVEGEVGFDITNKRLLVGDGSTAGGIPHVSYSDQQNSAFTSCLLTEASANVYTGTLLVAPTAYASFQEFLVKFPTGNTGSVTVNLNALGAKTVKKKSSGSLANLASGDIVAGAIHALFYDGTNLQISDINAVGLVSISQGDLNTSTGSVSQRLRTVVNGAQRYIVGLGCHKDSTSYTSRVSVLGGNVDEDFFTSWQRFDERMYGLTLPGGQYGFHPQTRSESFTVPTGNGVALDQRYITSSPPYDLGDGEVAGFMFLEITPSGEIDATYVADTPPWAYNGPTNIKATHIDKDGNKYRKKRKFTDVEAVLRGEEAVQESMELITHSLKNKDMALIPHPFFNSNTQNTVVLLDPMSAQVRKFIELQNAGEDLSEYVQRLKPDNDKLKRKGPKGVHQCKFSFSRKGQ